MPAASLHLPGGALQLFSNACTNSEAAAPYTQDRALDVVVHAMALPPAPAAPLAAEAAVVGPKRTLPGVKHSQWVADRSAVAVTDSRFSFASIMWILVPSQPGVAACETLTMAGLR